eukprot:1054389-Rhodomonas_salina.1
MTRLLRGARERASGGARRGEHESRVRDKRKKGGLGACVPRRGAESGVLLWVKGDAGLTKPVVCPS